MKNGKAEMGAGELNENNAIADKNRSQFRKKNCLFCFTLFVCIIVWASLKKIVI